MRPSTCLATLGVVVLASRVSWAEGPKLSLDRLAPAPAGDPTLAVESPHVRQGFGAELLLAYARSPLVAKGLPAGEARVVDGQVLAHGLLSVRLAERVGVDVHAPIVLAQSGESVGAGGVSLAKPSGGKLGDLRLGGRLLLSNPAEKLGVALSMRAFLPTGQSEQYTSAGTTRFAPAIVFGWADSAWVASLSVGRTFRTSSASTAGVAGSEIGVGAGVHRRFSPFSVGVEAFGATVEDGATDALARRTTNLEALGVGRAALGPVTLSLAAGPGVGHGVGTPAYRVVVGATFSTLPEPGAVSLAPLPSATRDEAADAEAARRAAEDEAARADLDGDGVPDRLDACPKVAGAKSDDPKTNGCPPDTDGDGIVDADDACRTVRGVASPDPKRNGCPGDKDKDGVTDDVDACPDLPGEPAADPKQNGCPKLIAVTEGKLEIKQQVQFETGKDVLRPESAAILSEVAKVMVAMPEIVRVAVDGHTDDVGVPAKNLGLSQRRALAVVRWLVDHGVDARRLEARGFGPRRPIADNKTAAGREQNRRVEFLIRKRSPKGQADWVDGPIE